MIRGSGTYRKPESCNIASHGLDPCDFLRSWITVQERTLFLDGNMDSKDLRCKTSLEKNVRPKASASRSKFSSPRDHARLARLSFAVAVVLTMIARRFQRTHPLSGKGLSLKASKDIGMGVSGRSVYCSGWLSSRWS